MYNWLKNIIKQISNLNGTVDKYQEESVIQSLPTVAYVNTAKKLIEERKFDEAEETLKKALDISEQDSIVYKYLGKIRERYRDFEKAIEYYKKSALITPLDKDIWLRLAMCQLYSKKTEEALASFEEANKRLPFNTDVYTGWGMAFMQQKKYAQAHEKFCIASKLNKYNYSAILLSAVMAVRLAKYSEAEDKLKFLVKVAPNETSLYEYANLKLIKEDFEEAQNYAQQALKNNPKMLPAYFILGEIYSTNWDIDKTEQNFQTALDNGLENDILYLEWAKAYMRFFDFGAAKKYFEAALSKNEECIEAKIGYALILSYKNNFDLLNELKEKNEKEPFIQQAIGLQALYNQDYNYAVEMFNKSLKNDKNLTYNYLLLARAYKNLDNKTKVSENYDSFTQKNTKYLSGYLEYAKWLIETNNYADAQRKLHKAEKINPNDNEVLNLLFYTSNILVRENVCEYNIKEVLKFAQRASETGNFHYENEKADLEKLLENLRSNN